jgi:D-alanyl-D-alanine carboxypeptidase
VTSRSSPAPCSTASSCRPLSCCGVFWGHGGDIDGYETRGGATDDGRSVGLAVTALPGTFGTDEQGVKAVMAATDTAFCR